MSEQPLALAWLCFIRDHGLDLKVTLGERALASLLPTYGQGKDIYVSMHTLAKMTGWSRNTVKKHRDGLIARGLLEDITGDPDKQSRTYRLTMPGYVSQTGSDIDPGAGQNLTQGDQNLTQGGSESDHNIKLEDQEVDQAGHHQPGEARDGVASDDDEGPNWIGNGKNATDNRAFLAEKLGVPAESIGAPLWRWLEDLGPDYEDDYDAMIAATQHAAEANNPVGYFRSILPGYIARYRAERAA